MTTAEYLTWRAKYETKFFMNHEGSASIRSFLSYLLILKLKFNFISNILYQYTIRATARQQ